MDKGVLYVATGKKYLDEALFSASSLKKVAPNLPVVLISDKASDANCFDMHITLENPTYTYKDKITGMSMSPFDSTLFLDTDTYICRNPDDTFCLLDKFDVAAAHDVKRRSKGLEDIMLSPSSFPEFNTGVIVYKKSNRTDNLFIEWKRLYDKFFLVEKERNQMFKGDQPSFREAVFNSNLQVYVLAPEYNLRLFGPFYLQQLAVILHGRLRYPLDYIRLDYQLNKLNSLSTEFSKMRVYLPGFGVFANGGRLIRFGKKLNWLNRLLFKIS